VILSSFFSNEAPVYPYFITPSKMLGLNGKKKRKKKKHLYEKTMIPSVPFSFLTRSLDPFPTRSHGLQKVSRPGNGAATGGGAAPPPSATLRRPLVPALPARVARASSGELPSTRARASSGELLSRRLPPASARRSPPQALPPSSRRALHPRCRRPPPKRCSLGPRGRLLVVVLQAAAALHRPALDLSCLGSMRAARPARALAWDLSEKGVRGGRATRRRRFLADVPGSGVCSMDEQPGGGVSEHLDGRVDPRGSHSPLACPRRRLPTSRRQEPANRVRDVALVL